MNANVYDKLKLLHFHTLDRKQQIAAIRRLIATGMSEHGVSHATGLSVEFIRRVLSEREVQA